MTTDEPEAKKARAHEKEMDERITVQFQTENGEPRFDPFSISLSIGPDQLLQLLRALFKEHRDDEGDAEDEDDWERRPFRFFVDEISVDESLNATLSQLLFDRERTVPVTFKAQASFQVRPVSRCTSSLPGHTQPVVAALFSGDGRYLASGSGDRTVRLWDLTTETPRFECKGVHSHYVLVLSWSPDGKRLASGDKGGTIALWDPEKGSQVGRTLTGHKQFITGIAWQPMHLTKDGVPRRLASSSKDGDVRIWDVSTFRCEMSLTSHTMNVTSIRWGGTDLLYSASQDRTIKVWRTSDGALCRTLQGHGHWVNVLALNTDYVMRTAAFDPSKAQIVPESIDALKPEELKQKAKKRYETVLKSCGGSELLVSGSDDFSLFLWRPDSEKKPLVRMTGHQQLVNDVKFSPDSRFVASASFDKSVRLWDGRTGKFLAVLRGHVQAVYQLAWSADSRLLVSGSADSTLKCWSVWKRKLEVDLPGHGDEVYAVDWSPDGQRVVSAGKDTLLRIWRK